MPCIAKKKEITEVQVTKCSISSSASSSMWSKACYLNFSGLCFPYLPDGDNAYPIPQRNAVKIKSDNICKLHGQMCYMHAYMVTRSL